VFQLFLVCQRKAKSLSLFLFLLNVEQAGEKGHVKPASFLDMKEKLLISIATKGGTIRPIFDIALAS